MGLFDTRPAEDFGFEDILYEKRDWVARITLNRPHNYNAYSTPALEELATAFRDAAFDDEVGVIVYTGAGDRAFCTGGDVKEYEALYTTKPRDYWKYPTVRSRSRSRASWRRTTCSRTDRCRLRSRCTDRSCSGRPGAGSRSRRSSSCCLYRQRARCSSAPRWRWVSTTGSRRWASATPSGCRRASRGVFEPWR